MSEDPNRRDDPENRSAADADTTSDVTSEESERSERATGTDAGAGAGGTGSALADAEGKTVVDHGGNTVGVVDEVEGGTLYVEPDPGLADRLSASLGWADRDDDDRPIDADLVDEVTDESVVLEHSGDVDADDDPAGTDVSGSSGASSGRYRPVEGRGDGWFSRPPLQPLVL